MKEYEKQIEETWIEYRIFLEGTELAQRPIFAFMIPFLKMGYQSGWGDGFICGLKKAKEYIPSEQDIKKRMEKIAGDMMKDMKKEGK